MSDLEVYADLAHLLIGRSMTDPGLLKTAFTHRSYLNEHRRQELSNNERLEFLGDAVLEIAVTDYLYQEYKHPEGILTSWRAALVRTESIAAAAKKLNFRQYLLVSKGENKTTDRALEQMLANVFEAVIGAIYLDQGYSSAKDFIHRHIISTLPNILEKGLWLDAKTRLQEHLQTTKNLTPVYKLLSDSGPDHDKTFVVGVYIDGKLCGRGEGSSKQAAQQGAAEVVLRQQGVKLPVVD